MKELSLPEIKEIELGILDMFCAFCKEHNIRYYLSHGTLLGAIRYKKFIPWDDDVDVLVPRVDYRRLLELFEDNEHYRLFAFEKDEAYRFPYAKLCDMTTFKDEPGYDNGAKMGLDIDVFPLDAWDDDPSKAKREVKRIRRNMFMLSLSKITKPSHPNPIKRVLLSIAVALSKMIGGKRLIRRIHRLSDKPGTAESKYLGCKAWCVYREKGIIPAEVFADAVDVEFEGQMYPAPKDWDTYLSCLYGDYLPEPPPEKRKTHHNFRAYRVE